MPNKSIITSRLRETTMDRPDLDEIWHRERHRTLHAALEELISDYIEHHPDESGMPEIHNLLHWSHEQTIDPASLVPEIRAHGKDRALHIKWIEWMRRN